MVESKVSVGVRVISILYFFEALVSFLVGISLILMLAMTDFLTLYEDSHNVAFLILLFFFLSFFFVLMGLALWKGKLWAIITAMIIAGIGVLGSMIMLVLGVTVVINVFLLLFHAAVLGFFFYELYRG